MMKFYFYFLLFACIYFSLISTLSANKCEEGWFGSECQYKCRCQRSCNPEGECPDKCEDGWFGYKCQYRLIQYKATKNKSQEDVTTIINDDDETTCTELNTEALVVDLNDFYFNPWIRLSTQKPETLYSLKMSYLDKNYKTLAAKSKKNILVRDNNMDAYISVDDIELQYLILESKVIQQICSLWINQGQNVAVKQKVYYSHSKISPLNTNLPQYPQATNDVQKCNKKDAEIVATNWMIIMNPSFIIKEYTFFYQDILGVERYATLDRYNNNGELYYTYTWRRSSNEYFGFVTPFKTPIKAFTLSMTSALTNKSITFSLCEVEAYTECSEGTWGEHCKNDCNEKCPDMCRFDDGLCSNTCFGYSDPPRCKKACGAGTWGLNCTKSCSKRCFNSSCDRQTGVCDKGCLGYSNPPQCNIDKPDETTIANASIIQSDTASQSTESENLEAFLIATVVMASVAASFTISTVIACYRYHSTKKKRLKDNYDELDTRITDRVFYHRPQVNAQNSSSSCASGYLDVVSSRSSSPRDTPAEAGTDANPYAEIGEMCMAGESKTADE